MQQLSQIILLAKSLNFGYLVWNMKESRQKPGPKPGPNGARTETFGIRLSPAHAQRLRERAARAGESPTRHGSRILERSLK
jgi:hypothetical protein